MDYDMIDMVMARKGIATDPAFGDALTISIESMPKLNGCPLGLYYPEGIIAIPPNATEAALLHELGHRHGHYYYNDLSEPYAEYFRKICQSKGRAMLYMGDDVGIIPKFGGIFEEGERGALEVALFQPLMPNEIYELKSQLGSYDEPSPRCYCGGGGAPFVRFEFTKGLDWMVIIGATLAGLVAVTAGIMGYAIYKVAEEHPWTTPIVILGIFAGIGLGLGLGAKYAPQLRGTWRKIAT